MGTLVLKSRVDLHLAPGSRLLGSPDLADYTRQGSDHPSPGPITADGPVAHLERPGHTLVLADCRDVSVSGVKFTDTAAWTMRIASCRGMHISGVTIHADCSIPNSDGIHLTSSRDAGVLSQSGSMCLLLHERRGRGAALARASVLG